MDKLGLDGGILFLGDYVDRGDNSCEVLLIVCLLKKLFPKKVFLLRGNHECKNVCKNYGYYKESCTKYSPKFFVLSLSFFWALPIAAKVEGTDAYFLAVHGGIPEGLMLLSDYNKKLPSRLKCLKKFEKLPTVLQTLWNDPMPNEEEYRIVMEQLGMVPTMTEEEFSADFPPNHERQSNDIKYFAYSATEDLIRREAEARAAEGLEDKPLAGILRAHQVPRGHGTSGISKQKHKVTNIFGASRYVGDDNRGSCLLLSESALYDNFIIDFSVVKAPTSKLICFDPVSEVLRRFPELLIAIARFGPLLDGCDEYGPALPAPVYASPVS